MILHGTRSCFALCSFRKVPLSLPFLLMTQLCQLSSVLKGHKWTTSQGMWDGRLSITFHGRVKVKDVELSTKWRTADKVAVTAMIWTREKWHWEYKKHQQPVRLSAGAHHFPAALQEMLSLKLSENLIPLRSWTLPKLDFLSVICVRGQDLKWW